MGFLYSVIFLGWKVVDFVEVVAKWGLCRAAADELHVAVMRTCTEVPEAAGVENYFLRSLCPNRKDVDVLFLAEMKYCRLLVILQIKREE